MKILITGGGGYVGTVLCRYLHQVDRSIQLNILDRFDFSVKPLQDANVGPLHVWVGDVREEATVHEALANMDAVIHLAAIVGYPACDRDPEDAYATNAEGTRWVAKHVGSRPLILASTTDVYGGVEGDCTEDAGLTPQTHYVRTKLGAEGYVLDKGGVVLRLGSGYGVSPRMRWDNLIHDFCRTAVKTGLLSVYQPDAIRNFLHVEDAARAFHAALTGTFAPGIWNVGDAACNLTKRAIAVMVMAQTGCSMTITNADDPSHRSAPVDYTKISHTAWEPHFRPADAIEDVCALARML